MFSALALNKKNIKSKINAFAAMAPVVSFKYQPSAEKEEGLKVFLRTAIRVSEKNKIYEIGPSLGNLREMIPILRLVPGINMEALRK